MILFSLSYREQDNVSPIIGTSYSFKVNDKATMMYCMFVSFIHNCIMNKIEFKHKLQLFSEIQAWHVEILFKHP